MPGFISNSHIIGSYRRMLLDSVWVLCPGVGEWDDAGERKDEEGGIGEGYGSTL